MAQGLLRPLFPPHPKKDFHVRSPGPDSNLWEKVEGQEKGGVGAISGRGGGLGGGGLGRGLLATKPSIRFLVSIVEETDTQLTGGSLAEQNQPIDQRIKGTKWNGLEWNNFMEVSIMYDRTKDQAG